MSKLLEDDSTTENVNAIAIDEKLTNNDDAIVEHELKGKNVPAFSQGRCFLYAGHVNRRAVIAYSIHFSFLKGFCSLGNVMMQRAML